MEEVQTARTHYFKDAHIHMYTNTYTPLMHSHSTIFTTADPTVTMEGHSETTVLDQFTHTV